MKKRIFIAVVLLLGVNFFVYGRNYPKLVTPGKKAVASKSEKKLDVVLVSCDIKNAQAIADAAKDEAVTIIYDSEATNLHLISLTLLEIIEWKRKKIDNLSIFCHGAPGSILLGANELIDLNNIKKNSKEWKSLGSLLTADANIDFYGCEIGWGVAGEKFVKAISYLTGAKVSASDDASGNIHDADWELEIHTGLVNKNNLIDFSILKKTPIYF